MKKVFLISSWDTSARSFFNGWMLPVLNPEEADLFVFSGGTDVNPAMYGEQRHWKTQDPDNFRDEEEKEFFNLAKKRGIPMFGICRGMQFFNVMQGGKLIQHMDKGGHYGQRNMHIGDGIYLPSTCCHHQAIVPTSDCSVLATSEDGTPEAAWWGNSRALGIQGHPEWRKSPRFVQYATRLVKAYCLGE